jgi:hypothetical protein
MGRGTETYTGYGKGVVEEDHRRLSLFLDDDTPARLWFVHGTERL